MRKGSTSYEEAGEALRLALFKRRQAVNAVKRILARAERDLVETVMTYDDPGSYCLPVYDAYDAVKHAREKLAALRAPHDGAPA